jgi:hypothetical protein
MRLTTACTVLTAATTATIVGGETTSASSSTNSRVSTILKKHRQQGRSLSTLENSSRRNKKDRLSSLFSRQRKQQHGAELGKESLSLKHEQYVGVLRNVVTPRQPSSTSSSNLQQCDPQPTTSTNEPDVGLLSCGLGQYCAVSSDSPMGGFCVSSYDDEMMIMTTAETTRDLQNDDVNSILNGIIDFCQGSTSGRSIGGGPMTCDKCTLDVAQYTGQINCTYAESCYVLGSLCPNDTDTTTFCERTSVEANLTGPDEYSYRV